MASTAKADVELLMNECVKFGKNMLVEHGEFYPYGAALSATGEIVSVGAKGASEHPPSAELISLLKTGFREGASKGEYIATALFYDVRIEDAKSTGMTDAIAVALDHRSNYSVIVFYPYKLQGGSASFGELFATDGSADIFVD
ncbi:MAG: hypothetical protein AAGH38_09150 [Pseudomonadota bacterium]